MANPFTIALHFTSAIRIHRRVCHHSYWWIQSEYNLCDIKQLLQTTNAKRLFWSVNSFAGWKTCVFWADRAHCVFYSASKSWPWVSSRNMTRTKTEEKWNPTGSYRRGRWREVCYSTTLYRITLVGRHLLWTLVLWDVTEIRSQINSLTVKAGLDQLLYPEKTLLISRLRQQKAITLSGT